MRVWMSSDTRRLAYFMYLKEERGYSSEVAARVVLALMPLDDDYKPGRAFRKGARTAAGAFAEHSKHYDAERADLLAKGMLKLLRDLAIQHGETYYAQRYDTALNSEAEQANESQDAAAGEDDDGRISDVGASVEVDTDSGPDDDLVALLAKDGVAAQVGEQVVLEDEEGTRLGLLISLHDPIEPSEDELGLDSDSRYVGVKIEVENMSRDESSFAYFTATLVDDTGEAYDSALATRDPQFDLDPVLDAGARVSGFLLFEMNEGVRPKRFVIGIGDTPAAAAWTLGLDVVPDSTAVAGGSSDLIEDFRRSVLDALADEDAVLADAPSDPIEQIRRLSELCDQGVLTNEEFKAKKAELLDRL